MYGFALLNTTIVFDIHLYHSVSTIIYRKVREKERKYGSRRRRYLQEEERKRGVQAATNSVQQELSMHWSEAEVKLVVASRSQEQGMQGEAKQNRRNEAEAKLVSLLQWRTLEPVTTTLLSEALSLLQRHCYQKMSIMLFVHLSGLCFKQSSQPIRPPQRRSPNRGWIAQNRWVLINNDHGQWDCHSAQYDSTWTGFHCEEFATEFVIELLLLLIWA